MVNELKTLDEYSTNLTQQDALIVGATFELSKNIANTVLNSLKESKDGKGDYGEITGIKNKCLFQPGADKICFAFGLAPKYTLIEKNKLDKGGYEVVMFCELVDIKDHNKVRFTSYGACSNTDKGRVGQPLDTIIKVAQKRAKVWAVLAIGSLRDIFIDEESVEAIKRANLITTGEFNDTYKTLFKLLLSQGHTESKIKSELVKPAMINLISLWNQKHKDDQVKIIGQLSQLRKEDLKEFIEFIGEKYGSSNK